MDFTDSHGFKISDIRDPAAFFCSMFVETLSETSNRPRNLLL